MDYLVGNPEDRFSRDEAQIIMSDFIKPVKKTGLVPVTCEKMQG